VKDLMGPKHITMTLRYTHLSRGYKRSAIAALDHIAEKVPTNFTTMAESPSDYMPQASEK
jgi:hypothetical protein